MGSIPSRFLPGLIRKTRGLKRREKSRAQSDLPSVSEATERLIQSVLRENLTYLEQRALRDLAGAVLEAEQLGLQGAIVEAGFAAGGSSIVLASVKASERPLKAYDVFGLIPPPSEEDGTDIHQRYQTIVEGKAVGINGTAYYGYDDNLYQKAIERFDTFNLPVGDNNIQFIKGLYQDTLLLDEPVALAHIDCDWYDSVMVCLQRIEPHVVPGGRIIIDDYHAWSGCRSAVDDYFASRGQSDFEFREYSRLHIKKMSISTPRVLLLREDPA